VRAFRWAILADSRWIYLVITFSGMFGLMPQRARADVTPRQVDAAIDKGVVFLLGLQHQDGSGRTRRHGGRRHLGGALKLRSRPTRCSRPG